jgi:hypothetical protein
MKGNIQEWIWLGEADVAWLAAEGADRLSQQLEGCL